MPCQNSVHLFDCLSFTNIPIRSITSHVADGRKRRRCAYVDDLVVVRFEIQNCQWSSMQVN